MKELRKVFWDAISITGATALSVPLMIASESIQARGLGPHDYGRVALIMSVISLLYLFGLYWLRNAVMRFAKEEYVLRGHFRKTTGTLLSLNLISLAVVISFFFCFRQNIFAFLGIELTFATGIVIIGLLLVFVKEYLLEILKVIRMIRIQAVLGKVVNKSVIVLGLVLLVLGVFRISVINVVLIFLIADLLTIILSCLYLKLSYLFPVHFDLSLLKKMLVFSFPLLFASWSGYIINWIDIYVINYFMTTQDVGVYYAAYKLLNAIQAFIGTSLIITISTPLIMTFKTTGQVNKIKDHYLKRMVPQLSFAGMIVISLLIMFSDLIFRAVYGADFEPSIVVFKILIASQSFYLISAAYTGIITSFDLTKIILYLGILAGLLNVLLDILLVPVFGITGAAMASCFVFSLIPVLRLLYVNRKFEVRKNTALIFPFVTLIIMLVNISGISFPVRIGFSLLILLVTGHLVRKYSIFRPQDANMLNNIDMSDSIREMMRKIVIFMSGK